jgi:hypothetical protein
MLLRACLEAKRTIVVSKVGLAAAIGAANQGSSIARTSIALLTISSAPACSLRSLTNCVVVV